MKTNIILKKLFLFISIYTSCITFGYAANPEVHVLCSPPEDILSCLPVEFRGAWPWYDYTLQVTVQTPTRRHVLVAADEHLAKH